MSILDHRGLPMMTDSVGGAIQSAANANPHGFLKRMFAPQLAFAAYLASGMMQKVIEIPAADRTREWRDWQADGEDVTKIEVEERRLAIVAKVKQAEVLRGIGGGALVIAAGGNPNEELRPQDIRPGGLVAINVVSRWQLTGENYDEELTSPGYGCPQMWRVTNTKGGAQLHPSRVIAFRGDPLPAGYGMSGDDLFWGQSRLVRIWREVERSDDAQGWFAALVRKAKLLRIAIPGLTDLTATPAGQAKIDRRLAVVAMGENTLNATVLDAGNGQGAGEEIKDYQVSWNGIPAMMDAFDQRVAAVADIPFTRLMGRSPAGMNATGEYDDQNWNKTVAAGQTLELRPCLEQLDALLLPSAGVDPAALWWKFSPLSKPNPAQEATRFKTTAEALEKVRDMAALPDRAFNAGVQGVIEENGWMPGASGELAKLSEDERFGLAPTDDGGDPSELQANGEEVIGSAGGGDADETD